MYTKKEQSKKKKGKDEKRLKTNSCGRMKIFIVNFFRFFHFFWGDKKDF